MRNNPTVSALNTKKQRINARQLAFFTAFLLPAQKLLELPSLLTTYAGGDLLIAALFGLALEFLPFCCLLLFAKRTGCAPIEGLERRCGIATARIFCGVYGVFLLSCAVLPLLDLEKFIYAAFYDTSPTIFSFAAFFNDFLSFSHYLNFLFPFFVPGFGVAFTTFFSGSSLTFFSVSTFTFFSNLVIFVSKSFSFFSAVAIRFSDSSSRF